MRTIGLIGGMSWESTSLYYSAINRRVRDRCGGLHSARLILFSVDFAEVAALQQRGAWDQAAAILADAAASLRRAGAEFLVLCTNTMHRLADAVESAGLPLLHIADPTAEAALAIGARRVALLGTRFTMEQHFYRDRLIARGLTVPIPDAEARAAIHRIIYDELCLGRIDPDSRAASRRIIADLVAQGAEAVILGCTELTLLIAPADSAVPLLDTTALHANAAADRALDPS